MSNIVITGANRGIGLEFVKQLSKLSRVFALCRLPESAAELQHISSENSNVHTIKADMTKFDEYDNVINAIQQNIKTGGVNLLVNNAGIMIKDNLKTVQRKSILESLEINALAPLLFTKALVPLLKKANSQEFKVAVYKPVVLNISAHLGSIEENKGDYLSYRLSKACLNMATKSLSVELKSQGIFVMALYPGWVKTDMGGKSAPLTVEQSVADMLVQLFNADDSKNGCLFTKDGHKIPW